MLWALLLFIEGIAYSWAITANFHWSISILMNLAISACIYFTLKKHQFNLWSKGYWFHIPFLVKKIDTSKWLPLLLIIFSISFHFDTYFNSIIIIFITFMILTLLSPDKEMLVFKNKPYISATLNNDNVWLNYLFEKRSDIDVNDALDLTDFTKYYKFDKKSLRIVPKNNVTPLMISSSTGNKAAVIGLINKGANVDQRDSAGYTSLMYACGNGKIDIVKILLENGSDLNITTAGKKTALMFAIENGHVDIAKILLDSGADKSIRNIEGKSAYDFAQNISLKDILK